MHGVTARWSYSLRVRELTKASCGAWLATVACSFAVNCGARALLLVGGLGVVRDHAARCMPRNPLISSSLQPASAVALSHGLRDILRQRPVNAAPQWALTAEFRIRTSERHRLQAARVAPALFFTP